MKVILAAIIAILPRKLKPFFYKVLLGYSIHPTASIGVSLIVVENCRIDENARIGSFNVVKDLSDFRVGENSIIGSFNWISGFPLSRDDYFIDSFDRIPALMVGRHSAITSRHIIDCTDSVTIGDFSTVGGFRSQILTHAINFERNIQTAAPVMIGSYSFLSTCCVVLKGTVIGDYVVVGANSTARGVLHSPYSLYVGAPAKRTGEFPSDAGYFLRKNGVVN